MRVHVHVRACVRACVWVCQEHDFDNTRLLVKHYLEQECRFSVACRDNVAKEQLVNCQVFTVVISCVSSRVTSDQIDICEYLRCCPCARNQVDWFYAQGFLGVLRVSRWIRERA